MNLILVLCWSPIPYFISKCVGR